MGVLNTITGSKIHFLLCFNDADLTMNTLVLCGAKCRLRQHSHISLSGEKSGRQLNNPTFVKRRRRRLLCRHLPFHYRAGISFSVGDFFPGLTCFHRHGFRRPPRDSSNRDPPAPAHTTYCPCPRYPLLPLPSCCPWSCQRPYIRDDALLYIAYVMLIWVTVIPATRWSCSQPPCT